MENNLYILFSIFTPLIGAILALVFVHHNRIQRWIAVFAGLIAWGCTGIVLGQVLTSGAQTYRMGGYIPPYGIVMVADELSALFAFMASLVMLTGSIYNLQSKEKSVGYPAFVSLFLAMQTGLTGAFLTGDLFTFFVFMEVMVLSSVAMVAVSDNPFGLKQR